MNEVCVLPDSPLLGPLDLVEVYEYHDQPVLFACRDRAGQTYLALLLEQAEDADTWWYVPLSPVRFEALRTGQIELREAFVSSETGRVLERRWPHAEGTAPAERWRPANDLGSARLPVPGERLA